MVDESKKPPGDLENYPYGDRVVFGICELLALLFGLPFGEDLYRNAPITRQHYFYLPWPSFLPVLGQCGLR